MTETEKLLMLKTLLGVTDTTEDEQFKVFLTAAAREIIAWRYSYSSEADKRTSVPPEYEMTQIYAVIAGYSQSGAENQHSHSENGISRTFKHADMIAYIRANVMPYVGVL